MAENTKTLTIPTVELIPAGYEWRCDCGEINHEMAFVPVVRCHNCDRMLVIKTAKPADNQAQDLH